MRPPEEALLDEHTVSKSSVVSACGKYRFSLSRRWDARPRMLVIAFAPTVREADQDDLDVRLLSQIALNNGFGGLNVVYLCPLRTAEREAAFAMLSSAQVDGDLEMRGLMWKNLGVIEHHLRDAGGVLVAWGEDGPRAGVWLASVVQTVMDRCKSTSVFHIGRCRNGQPKRPVARAKHTLLLDAADMELLPWRFE